MKKLCKLVIIDTSRVCNMLLLSAILAQSLLHDTFSDTRAKLTEFECRFEKLQLTAYTELELKQNSLEMIQERLIVMPRIVMKKHHEHMMSILKRDSPFLNLSIFLKYLNLNCWNLFEYQLLKDVIERFCSSDLKAEMVSYDHDMHLFQQQTTLFNFIKSSGNLIALKRRSIPPHFRKLVLEHGTDPDSYKLGDLERFRTDTCMHLKMSQCALQLYFIKDDPIVIEWIFPEEITLQLSCFYCSEDGQQLLQIHLVDKALIDGCSLSSVSITIGGILMIKY